MSNGLEKEGAADFLSSISFGSSDSQNKHSKRRRSGQRRESVSKYSNGASKSHKAPTGESEAKTVKSSKPPSTSSLPEDTLSKSPGHGSHHKRSEPIHTPSKLRTSHGHGHHRHEHGHRGSNSAALDFLSGIQLGKSATTEPHDDSKAHTTHTPTRNSDLYKLDLSTTPTKSSPAPLSSPRSARHPKFSEPPHSDEVPFDFFSPNLHEDDVLDHEASLLFPQGEELPSPMRTPSPIPATILTSKAFLSTSKKVIKDVMEGERIVWAIAASPVSLPSRHAPALGSSSRKPHSFAELSHHAEAGSMPYGAIVVSSLIFLDKDNGNLTPGANPAATSTLNPASLTDLSISNELDKDESLDSSNTAKGGAKSILKGLKKPSISYVQYVKPSQASATLNAHIIASLPSFRLPADAVLLGSTAAIFKSSDDLLDQPSSTTTTPRGTKLSSSGDIPTTPRNALTGSGRVRNSPIAADLNPAGGKSWSGDANPLLATSSTPNDPKSARNKTSSGEIPSLSAVESTRTRASSVSAQVEANKVISQVSDGQTEIVSTSEATAGSETSSQNPLLGSVPQAASQAAKLHVLDPYERCLQKYDPIFLEIYFEKPSKFLIKSFLPGYTSSIMHIQSSKTVRHEENEAFKEFHTWMTTDLKLSKIRSVKRKLELVATAQTIDIACTALAHVYFEKLILRNIVWSYNARCFGAVCLLLAAKFYGVKVLTFSPLIRELAARLKVSPKEVLANEFFVYRKLHFSLFVEPDEVMPHFLRLRSSPASLDKEFSVQQRERKRNQKKQAQSSIVPQLINTPVFSHGK